jgi:hypothetical protein
MPHFQSIRRQSQNQRARSGSAVFGSVELETSEACSEFNDVVEFKTSEARSEFVNFVANGDSFRSANS